MSLYDSIGRRYTATRRADPRIAAAIHEALGDARTVVNVGAGAGAYEPDDRWVLAVDPSRTMLAQRPPGAAPAIVASAEDLPLADAAVDAAMAVLTIHHWADWRRGVDELRRVARRRIVVLTFDPAAIADFWFVRDYLPEIGTLDAARCPPVDEFAAALAPCEVLPLEVPRDCRDGMLAAFYARPEAYLDPEVRAGMSPFAVLPETTVRAALDRLADDLRTGAWDRRHGDLRERPTLEAGYRLVVASVSSSPSRSGRLV